MPQHARNELRKSLRTILEDTDTALAQSDPASVVFASFELAKAATAVPSFSYWIETEPVESIAKDASSNRVYQRTADVVIIVLAKDVDELDQLCEEVELGLANAYLGMMTLLSGTTFVENVEGEKHYYGARLSYAVVYTTVSNVPSVSQQSLSPQI